MTPAVLSYPTHRTPRRPAARETTTVVEELAALFNRWLHDDVERLYLKPGDVRRFYRIASWSARDLRRIATHTAALNDPRQAAAILFGGA